MSDNAALSWNNAGLEAIRRMRMGPPMAARALHVLHAAMYDAWAAHDDLAFGSRLGDELPRPAADRTPEAKREAASFAAHRAPSDLFPTEATAFAKLMSDLGYDPDAAGPEGSPGAVGWPRPGRCWPSATATAPTSSATWGLSRAGWPPPTPTGPAPGRPIRWPGWPTPTAGSRCPPPTVSGSASSSPTGAWSPPSRWRPAGTCGRAWGRRSHPGRSYLFQAEQVLADSAGLTDEHKAIVEYWADGPGSETPPGHWCLHAQQVSA
jgi:hypothetical protein